jgi:tetratricopeptide (TPR) repeat protein
MQSLLAKLEKYALYGTVFLLPIALLPISPNLFIPGRLSVLTLGVALILLIKAIRIILSGKLEFQVGSLDFPVLLLALAYLLSAILRTPNKMEAYLLPGTATAVIGGALLYYLVNQLAPLEKKVVLILLLGSGGLFALILLLAATVSLSSVPGLPAAIRSPGFTPDGGYAPASILLLSLLPLGISEFISQRDTVKKAVSLLFSILAIVAIVASIYQMLPGKSFSPRFPSLGVTWNVAIDSLKQSPVLGIGPGNYITAFSRFKPITYNATDLWPVRFATGRDFYLTALTEVGLLGLAALAILLFSIYKSVKLEMKEAEPGGLRLNPAGLALCIFLVLMLLFPATVLLTILLFILLSLFAKTTHTSLNLTSVGATGASSRLPSLIVSLPVIAGVLLLGFYLGRVLAAEYSFKQGVDALAQGDGQTTYDKVRGAIRLNPSVDRYHSTFSQLNLAIARNLAQKQDLTDAERTTLTQLVQQSINEGKAAVALNPPRAGNWEVLAEVYRSIMSIANGADAFAIQTYSQAVALDPLNPNLRISLGGVYYGLKRYDEAVKVMELAVATKPDLANGHYNLAFAYRDNGEIDKAVQQMTLVLSLIQDKASQDYQTAKAALEDLEKRRQATPAAAAETLTPPQGQIVPPLEPPLELPQGSQPPESPVSPSPTPTP